jgi:MFS family permease
MENSQDKKKILGVVPNVFFLGLVSFFNDFSHEMVKAVMPVFLTTVLGATPAFVGFLDGFADAVASLLRLVSGWFSDKFGERKRLAVFGYIISLATRWLLVIAGGAWHVFSLRVIDRIGKGIREAPRDALVSVSVEDKEASVAFGFQRGFDALGGVIGPLLAILLLPLVHEDYRVFFVIASSLGLLSLFAFGAVKDVKIAPGLRPQNSLKAVFSLKHYEKGFKVFLLALLIFNLGSMPVALLVLRAQSFDCCSQGVPFLYLIYAIAGSLFSIPAGYLARAFGRRRILLIGFICAIFGALILAGSNSMFTMAFSLALFGVHAGFTDGIQRAYASKLLARNHIAVGHGALQATLGMASLVAGTIGGLSWTFFGSTPTLFGASIFMTIGLVVFVTGHHKAPSVYVIAEQAL